MSSVDTMDLELKFLLPSMVSDPAEVPDWLADKDEPRVYELIPPRESRKATGPCPWVGLLDTGVSASAYTAGLHRRAVTITPPTPGHARRGAQDAILEHAADVVREVIETRRTSLLRGLLTLLEAAR